MTSMRNWNRRLRDGGRRDMSDLLREPGGFEGFVASPRIRARSCKIATLSPRSISEAYWFANGAHDKPALATEPTSWVPGFHNCTMDGSTINPDLRMSHLHRMDFDICRDRHLVRKEGARNGTDVRDGWVSYNRAVDDGEFESQVYEKTGLANRAGPPIRVE